MIAWRGLATGFGEVGWVVLPRGIHPLQCNNTISDMTENKTKRSKDAHLIYQVSHEVVIVVVFVFVHVETLGDRRSEGNVCQRTIVRMRVGD